MTNPFEHHEQAAELLFSIWRTIDPELKAAYKRTIWGIFESRVKVAATQNSTLVSFAGQLCKSLQASLGRNDAERIAARSVLESGKDEQILWALRKDTAYIVLLVKEKMVVVKEQFEEEYTDEN